MSDLDDLRDEGLTEDWLNGRGAWQGHGPYLEAEEEREISDTEHDAVLDDVLDDDPDMADIAEIEEDEDEDEDDDKFFYEDDEEDLGNDSATHFQPDQ